MGTREMAGATNPVFYIGDDDHSDDGKTNNSIEDTEYAPVKIQRSTKIAFFRYCESSKGQDMSMDWSQFYAITLTVISLSVLLSEVLPSKIVDDQLIDNFFSTMYVMSAVCIVVLFILNATDQLTTDREYKQKKNIYFVMGGMLVLGSGALIYHAIVLAEDVMSADECLQVNITIKTCLAILFTVLQVALLFKFIAVRINKNLWIILGSRFLLMQIVATNIAVWLRTVIKETIVTIDNINQDEELQSAPENSTHVPPQTSTVEDQCESGRDSLENLMAPYMFPLLIQFCVTGTMMLYRIWEMIGHGYEPLVIDECSVQIEMDNKKKDHVGFLENMDDSETLDSKNASGNGTNYSSSERDSGSAYSMHYNNTNDGFIFGWLVLLTTVVITIVCLYETYVTPSFDSRLNTMVYSTNMGLTLLCVLMIPYTVYQMSGLTFKDEEIKAIRVQRDDKPTLKKHVFKDLVKSLLAFTMLAVMAFKIMSMIAAYEQGEHLIFADGIVSIIFAYLQVVFINAYAFQKRSTTEEQRRIKPGYQQLVFLQLANLALWLINTFVLKNPDAKSMQENTFGEEAWAIISNLLQPPMILFYFHSASCISMVMQHSYSTKYIGVVRPRKARATRTMTIESDMFSLDRL